MSVRAAGLRPSDSVSPSPRFSDLPAHQSRFVRRTSSTGGTVRPLRKTRIRPASAELGQSLAKFGPGSASVGPTLANECWGNALVKLGQRVRATSVHQWPMSFQRGPELVDFGLILCSRSNLWSIFGATLERRVRTRPIWAKLANSWPILARALLDAARSPTSANLGFVQRVTELGRFLAKQSDLGRKWPRFGRHRTILA